MYHSTSAVLSNGQVLVAGSNENNRYVFEGVLFPTELRVEKFSPPYLDPKLSAQRPKMLNPPLNVNYGGPISFQYGFDLPPKEPVDPMALKVTMLSPPFTTHGFLQQQRMLVLDVRSNGPGLVEAIGPPNPKIVPSGYYMMFLVHRGLPSNGYWVKLSA